MTKRAVALISGGLDSMLATRAMQEQGIYVEGINFFTGFCVEGHTHAIRANAQSKPNRNHALMSAKQLGIPLHIIDIVEEYKDVVLNPKHGYGAHMNPCLDCKIFMVKKAWEWCLEHDFDFVITGEVIGQRPMSQRASTMPVIAQESGALDRVVRPLSGQLIAETLPERAGWIQRDQMYDFHGRSRKPQMALAEKYGFKEYAQPAGGCCFLTDKNYTRKLADMWIKRGDRTYSLDDVMLLKVGRHLRPSDSFKMIVGREEGENRYLSGYRKSFISIIPESHDGAFTLIDGKPTKEELLLATRIASRYSKATPGESVTMRVTRPGALPEDIEVSAFGPDEILEAWRL